MLGQAIAATSDASISAVPGGFAPTRLIAGECSCNPRPTRINIQFIHSLEKGEINEQGRKTGIKGQSQCYVCGGRTGKRVLLVMYGWARLLGRHGLGEVSGEVDVDAVHDGEVWCELTPQRD